MKRTLSTPLSSLIAALALCGCGGGHGSPAAYSLRHTFQIPPGAGQPRGGLVDDTAGNLYGTASTGGTKRFGAVYRIDAVTGVESVLYSFLGVAQNDAQNPIGQLVFDSTGDLYGVASNGGSNDVGAVFRIDANSHAESLVHSFAPGPQDGALPSRSLLIDGQGDLFGTTTQGGANDTGTVYEITPDGRETLLASFGQAAAGKPAVPRGELALDSAGNLYGTTQFGGSSGHGTVWELASSSRGATVLPTVLHSFAGPPADGTEPVGGVLLDAASGTLYGTTQLGGINDAGTVFRCGVDGSGERIVYAFADISGNDGAAPMAPLVMDSSGVLYGTTDAGGSGYGTVFAVDPASGRETVLHRFGGYPAGDGQTPLNARLMIDTAGQLVGVTQLGGANNTGVIYRLPR